jgi:dTDP-4-dehydrorhamnose reductase
MHEKFLVLGHKGFLGQSIYSSLVNCGSKVTTISSYIDLKNLKDIASEYFTHDTIVINCLASGVTPYTSDKSKDILINAELLGELLAFFIDSRSSKFIQFGSIYEIDADVKTVNDRLAYVNSKALGSHITKSYGEKDARVKLMYLPTILGHNQPAGRFFRDFIRAANKNSSFLIHNPNSTIKVSLYDSFFKYLCTVIRSADESVFHLPVDARMSVVEFSKLLNSLLVKNGFSSAQLVMNVPDQIKQNKSELNEDFVAKIEQMIISVAEKSK